MLKIKIFAIMLLLGAVLMFGAPAVSRASAAAEMPPAVVFVQDREKPMQLTHNFIFDDGMLVPQDMDTDQGFYVDVQASK